MYIQVKLLVHHGNNSIFFLHMLASISLYFWGVAVVSCHPSSSIVSGFYWLTSLVTLEHLRLLPIFLYSKLLGKKRLDSRHFLTQTYTHLRFWSLKLLSKFSVLKLKGDLKSSVKFWKVNLCLSKFKTTWLVKLLFKFTLRYESSH